VGDGTPARRPELRSGGLRVKSGVRGTFRAVDSYARKSFLDYLGIALRGAENTERGVPWPGSRSRPKSTRWPMPSAETWKRHCALLGLRVNA
jgi:hypothetical protein